MQVFTSVFFKTNKRYLLCYTIIYKADSCDVCVRLFQSMPVTELRKLGSIEVVRPKLSTAKCCTIIHNGQRQVPWLVYSFCF